MTLTAVVAVTANGVIGRDNDMPWHFPDDLRHFKQLTLGKTLLMGRRTFESIGRPLPGRRTVVLTRDPDWAYDGVEVVHSAAEARGLLGDGDAVLAGGGEIYREFWDEVDVLEVTHIHREIDGDTRLPDIDPATWTETSRDDRQDFSWVGYQRR